MTGDPDHAPRSGLWIGWVILAVLVIGLLISGWFIVRDESHSVSGRPTVPPMLGGGGPLAETPSARRPSAPGMTPSQPPGSSGPSITSSPGGDFDVAGVGKNLTIECRDHDFSVSGVENTVILTGRCARVDVSGVRNTVVIDSAESIDVSGMDNKVTFRSGTPRLRNSGLDNTLDRG